MAWDVPGALVAVTDQLRVWFEDDPGKTGRELLERLQREQPGDYLSGLLRTVQGRLKGGGRNENAWSLVFANTIGNLVDDGVSSGGKAKADDTYATHTVTDGQTAWGLSQAGGYTLDQLQAVNQGVDLANLDIGQTLNLPFMASDISRQMGAAFAERAIGTLGQRLRMRRG